MYDNKKYIFAGLLWFVGIDMYKPFFFEFTKLKCLISPLSVFYILGNDKSYVFSCYFYLLRWRGTFGPTSTEPLGCTGKSGKTTSRSSTFQRKSAKTKDSAKSW